LVTNNASVSVAGEASVRGDCAPSSSHAGRNTDVSIGTTIGRIQ
jgi:hypothetical protein